MNAVGIPENKILIAVSVIIARKHPDGNSSQKRTRTTVRYQIGRCCKKVVAA